LRVSAILLVVILAVVGGLTGCGGDNKSAGSKGPAKVTVTYTARSLTIGDVVTSLAQPGNLATYDSSNELMAANYSFKSSNPDFVDVANNGWICAGTWDSDSNPVVCNPGTKSDPTLGPKYGAGVGRADITVTASNGAGSATSDPITIYVHPKVDSIEVSSSVSDCVSQKGTAQFTAKAFGRGVDITDSIGKFQWSAETATGGIAAGVLSLDDAGKATALNPGLARVYATVTGATPVKSSPVMFITCPVTSIDIHVKDSTDTSFALDANASKTLTADVFDSKGNRVILTQTKANSAISGGELSWIPAAFLTAGVAPVPPGDNPTTVEATVTAKAAGRTGIVAMCVPPICNNGLPIVFSNVVTATTNGTTATTVYAAGTDSTSLVPISTSNNTAGTAITLKAKPNSFVFSPTGNRAYLGSADGMMALNPSTNTVTDPDARLKGKVLAVVHPHPIALGGASPKDVWIILSDSTKQKVYFVIESLDANNNVQTSITAYNVPNVEAAAFSADWSRLYLLGGGKLTTITNRGAAIPVALDGTDVAFLANGSFAYTASGANVHAFATCNNSQVGSVGAPGSNAKLLKTLPNASKMIVVDPPNIDALTVSSSFDGCPPTLSHTTETADLGAGTFTPRQLLVSPDSTRAFVITDQAGVFTYKVADNTAASIGIGGAIPFTGGITADGNQLFVGASDKKVHRIDLSTNTDAQQYTLEFTPDLVVVKP